jgi:hypothetical protein
LLAIAAAIARLNFRCPNCGRFLRNVLSFESCDSCRVPLQPDSLRDFIESTRWQGRA